MKGPMSSEPFIATMMVPANDGPVVLGSAAFVMGCLILPGDVILRGRVEGEIRASGVLVSVGGSITGTVVTNELIVEGVISDSLIYADRIVLRRGSVVTGEIWHRELVLEAGHLFEGKSRRHDDPRTLAPAEPECADISEFMAREPDDFEPE
ncbi:MAG: hypothetical protein B7Y80_12915 [Hyphomicrobium sp. 32-62-53]|nr:MAG: hypothetical protein B7Z29_13310 [Hyphomicrobium sp. 12-62-95]OYX98937.1 MAG: hypothetical protein B7Y80_12915 [Hyphomicrobium sp. 32-62-53]